MLTEIREVKQEAGGRRRWFEDDGLELIVWYGPASAVEGFQICYTTDAGRQERALTWRAADGFAHARVEPGDDSPLKNQTPILVPDGTVPWAELEAEFGERSRGLEAELRQLVLARLQARR
ncbi:MAG TPA: hypothetical protein VHE13_12175 [Opitutus sp.]|nr:hypothetical protein [Opitutus sp.]